MNYMLPSYTEVTKHLVSTTVSSPVLRNSIGIATAAHTARYFHGPLAGFAALTSLASAAFYTSSRPYLSVIGSVSLYYGPKALEVTIQKTVSEAGVWLLKTGAKATVFVIVEGGKALYNMSKKPSTTPEIPLPADTAVVKKENQALKRQVTKLNKQLAIHSSDFRRITRSMTHTLPTADQGVAKKRDY